MLKRTYRHAARAQTRALRGRARNDIKTYPALVDRIADYLRYVVPVSDYFVFVENMLSDAEQVYPDVNYQLVESLLKLEPTREEHVHIRQLAQKLLRGKLCFPGSDDSRNLVPLLYLRYGDKRNVRALSGKLGERFQVFPPPVARSICAVLSGYGEEEFQLVQQAASRLLKNHLSEFVKMIERIKRFEDVPGRFKNRIRVSCDSITGAKHIDMRTYVAARLLGLSSNANVKRWLVGKKSQLLSDTVSAYEKKLIRRLWPG